MNNGIPWESSELFLHLTFRLRFGHGTQCWRGSVEMFVCGNLPKKRRLLLWPAKILLLQFSKIIIWCSWDSHGRLEEFVADGVHVIGRRGTDETIQTFFVIELRITVDAPMLVPAPAQATLPLIQPQRGTER